MWCQLQVPVVAVEAKAALAAGQAVVIGLQSTGEAAADAMQLEPGQVCGFVSTTRELLSRFVTQHFPVRYEPGPNEPAGISINQFTFCAFGTHQGSQQTITENKIHEALRK